MIQALNLFFVPFLLNHSIFKTGSASVINEKKYIINPLASLDWANDQGTHTDFAQCSQQNNINNFNNKQRHTGILI
jgi:hypothetical protein